jgi:BASS family bile acid:Na+ symporter
MLRLKDFLLLIVIYSSVLTGVLFPRASSVFQPVPLYSMMSLLFLSFLPIKIGHIWQTIRHFSWTIFLFVIFRMLFLPTCIALLFRLIWPAYSLSALLLSGISTGVVAPFISNLLGGNSPLVLVMVVVTSLLVPFTLPPLVGLLFGQTMHISLFSMTRLLSIVIFIPILSVEVVRKVFPGLAEVLMRTQYHIALVLFAMTNLGIFSKYSEFFYQKPMTIAAAALASFILGALYLMAGLFISWGRTVEDQLAAVISLGIMNNVLVIVFSSEFFTPIEPTVAAMYMIPFFALIIPLRAYRGWKVGK